MDNNSTASSFAELLFTKLDYSIFGLMLGLSTIIGIYFGFCSKQKQDNTDEYLLGSKQMKIFPVAVSLTATHISAVTLLGVPAEIYRYGIQYWACCISGLVVTICMSNVYLPVFHELQSSSCYYYLEKRFDKKLRTMASSLFIISCVLYLPIIVYAPAIAFSQVTGVNLHVITPIMCIICIFYTTFGGLRAVVWTDTLQFVAMVGSIIIVMILGTLTVGGFINVFEIAERGQRLIWFNMDPDPYLRSSFWMVSVGLTSMWISNIGVTPECVQRVLSVPTLSDSRKVVWIFGIGHILVKLSTVYSGLIIYAKYSDCDPVTTGIVEKQDQIFPYYVMDVARAIPGLPGLFVAGVFSAALSSMSSSLNSLSGTIYVDFLKPSFPNASEKTASNIMKSLVIVVGLICLGLVFVVERLGSIFSLAIALSGVTAGPLLGLFTLGMIFPKANKTGAFYGSIVSLIILSVLGIGAQFAIAGEMLKYPSLPFRTDGCEAGDYPSWNISSSNSNSTPIIYNEYFDNSSVPWFFRIGFMYYSLIGTLIVFIVGYPISLLTGGCPDLDSRLLAPFVRRFYTKYNTVNIKMKDVLYSEIKKNKI